MAPSGPATSRGACPRRRSHGGVLGDDLAAVRCETHELLGELLVAQEMFDEAERAALATFDEAAGRPRDGERADRAVAAALACDHAREVEHEAAERWVRHRERLRALLEQSVASSAGLETAADGRS